MWFVAVTYFLQLVGSKILMDPDALHHNIATCLFLERMFEHQVVKGREIDADIIAFIREDSVTDTEVLADVVADMLATRSAGSENLHKILDAVEKIGNLVALWINFAGMDSGDFQDFENSYAHDLADLVKKIRGEV